MRFLFAILIVLFPASLFAGLEETYKATAKIVWKSGDCGTAVVFKEDKQNYYLLTDEHVVQDEPKNPFIQFFFTGESISIEGQTIMSDPGADVAIIKINKDDLKKYGKPCVIPLAEKDYVVKEDDVVISCGCTHGDWPTLWIGHVESVDRYLESFDVVPRPFKGRSGSGVFDKDGNHIIGLIQMTDGQCIGVDAIRGVVNSYFK